MQSNYRKLGVYIEPVSFLNADLQYGEDDVRGVSNNKEIIQTRANNKGRDFSKFYVVAANEFIYNSRTSRMGDKVGLGYNDTEKSFITSFNNTAFRVKNEALLPMYLYMWFNRPEFDRYVRFHSWGSSTEIFSWEDMCNVSLPIPSPEKQREIVTEYNVIQNRIKLNNQLIQKLEETAQTIYKQWFVDFEFPDENGLPYKSSGGAMVFNEELDKEIPEGWEVKFLSDYVIMSQGIQVDVEEQLLEKGKGMNRFLRIIDYTPDTDEVPRFVSITDERYFCSFDEIAMIRYGDAGTVCRRLEGIIANNLFKISPLKDLTNNFLYYFFKNSDNQKIIKTSDLAVAMPAITHKTIKELPIVFPRNHERLILNFDNSTQVIENKILMKIKEIENLKSLSNLLLSKLATIEN